MIAALRTEYRKLVTTRLWWILLLTLAGYMAFLGAVMAFVLLSPGAMGPGGAPQGPPMEHEQVVRTIYTLASSLGYVFPVIVGALSVTGEFRHMTVTPTLLAEPSRTRLLGAKLLAAVPVGLLFGLGGVLGTVLGGAPVLALQGEPTLLGDVPTLRALGATVVVLTVWAVVGVGFGAALPNQVAAVVVLIAFNQLVEPVLRFALGAFDATAGVAKYLPGAAGDAVTGETFFATAGGAELLEPWQGLVVLLGYAIVLATIGRLTTFRRDVT